jgi:hypothetical protein
VDRRWLSGQDGLNLYHFGTPVAVDHSFAIGQ